MKDLKIHLKTILKRHEGRRVPITSQKLSELTGEKDRTIRLAIRELISEGLPVASSTEAPAGYFLVTNYEEARAYADSIKRRLIEDARRRRDFRRAADCHLKPALQGRLVFG